MFKVIGDHLNHCSLCDWKILFSFIYTLAEFLTALFGSESNVFRLYPVTQHLWSLTHADRDLLVFRMQICVCFLIHLSQRVYEQIQTPFILMILAACIQLHAMKYLAHFRSLARAAALIYFTKSSILLIGWKWWYRDILLWKINE